MIIDERDSGNSGFGAVAVDTDHLAVDGDAGRQRFFQLGRWGYGLITGPESLVIVPGWWSSTHARLLSLSTARPATISLNSLTSGSSLGASRSTTVSLAAGLGTSTRGLDGPAAVLPSQLTTLPPTKSRLTNLIPPQSPVRTTSLPSYASSPSSRKYTPSTLPSSFASRTAPTCLAWVGSNKGSVLCGFVCRFFWRKRRSVSGSLSASHHPFSSHWSASSAPSWEGLVFHAVDAKLLNPTSQTPASWTY